MKLAEIVQSYAEKCQWRHNPDRLSSYPGYVGENLYITTAAIARKVQAQAKGEETKQRVKHEF